MLIKSRFIVANLVLVIALAALYRLMERWGHAAATPRDHRDLMQIPELELPLVNRGGTRHKLRLNHGGEAPVRVINFWASWCSSCREESGIVHQLGDVLGRRMVGVATLDDAEAVHAAEAQAPHSFPIVLDADGAVAKRFGVDALPQTFVTDTRGKIIKRYMGALTLADVAEIKQLVGAPTEATSH